MKKYVFLIFLYPTLIFGQDKSSDLHLIRSSTFESEEWHEKDDSYQGLLRVYHEFFSEQLINDCSHQFSCSEFSQGALRYYGMVKGTFLTADRLMRCNRISISQLPPVRFNQAGHIIDHWEDYQFK
jgi:putative component of membrane protein insertase Oxa1/YidC/SpoIIIJ protein YidD